MNLPPRRQAGLLLALPALAVLALNAAPSPADDPNHDGRMDYWAFRPLTRPPSPRIPVTPWVRNPVDHFVLARLQSEGLAPSPEADRPTLLRRLKFDLLGLPPTPEEVAAFAADRDPLAYERLVDRYLASPQYGECWARHWLDVVRFAESDGFETNPTRPNAWPYRDYVIRSFNEDRPYDRFVQEQLAGDLLGADEATGFLVGGAFDRVKSPDVALTLQQRADELHDMVSTTCSTFLGLTGGTGRCHNHKFDPVSQLDYYRLKAVSTTPLQALNLLHGTFVVQQADLFARRVEKEAGNDPAARVRRAFRLAFRREATAEELAAALPLVREHGLAALCLALLNANEFLYVF
jgi:hypothetical protein